EASAGSLEMQNVTLAEAIAWAYRVQKFQIQGAKLADNHYDISAKAEPGADELELRAMLRSLLAERFHLALHREPKMTTLYALVAGRNLQLEKSAGDAEYSIHGQKQVVVFDHITMAEFAELLGTRFKIPVIDATGLGGRFKFAIDASRYLNGGPEVDDLNGEDAALFMAIEDQVGLLLDHRRESVDTLVVDRAEKPAEN
ncbi:MAG TPA: TIGR03435 family protein, partial [Bryobacteraceae bacterium]|nr:TIGR03435 family protein [Bryobacteraceae bacterium]